MTVPGIPCLPLTFKSCGRNWRTTQTLVNRCCDTRDVTTRDSPRPGPSAAPTGRPGRDRRERLSDDGPTTLTHSLGYPLGRQSLAPVDGKAGGRVGVFGKEKDTGPRPGAAQPARLHLRREACLRQQVARAVRHTLRNVSRQVRHRRRSPNLPQFPAFGQLDGEAPRPSLDPHQRLPAARRVEPPARQFHLYARAHLGQHGQKHAPGKRPTAPSPRASPLAASEAIPRPQRQWEEDRLQHQPHRSGAAAPGRIGHVKEVLAGTRHHRV